MNKIYLFFILVCCVQSYLLPFSYHLWLRFSLPLIKITARIDRLQMQRNWQGLRIEIQQSPHIHWPVWPSCFLRGHICCTDYWQLNGIHVTVCLGLNFRRKNKILRLTCGKCSLKKNSNRINICLLNIEAEYEYCIVHFMNGLLNQQTKSFFL